MVLKVNPRQLKAARALAGWTGDKLAEHAGVSRTPVRNFERGGSQLTVETLEKIVRTFGAAGVEFTEDGVRETANSVTIFNDFTDIVADIRNSLRKGEEALFHCADESRSSDEVLDMTRTLSREGVVLRFTVPEGKTHTVTGPETCRMIPAELAAANVNVIYADKVVHHVQDGDKDVFIMIRSPALANDKRREFEIWWNTGKEWPEDDTRPE